MPHYSVKSEDQLDTAEHDLQRLFSEVIKHYDNTIIQGWRPLFEQEKLWRAGLSKVKQGKHNTSPSQAVDSAPYLPNRGIPWPQVPQNWANKSERDAYIKDIAQFYSYGGFVLGVAANMGIQIRWGGDWDRDNEVMDQSFNDLVHFELVNGANEV